MQNSLNFLFPLFLKIDLSRYFWKIEKLEQNQEVCYYLLFLPIKYFKATKKPEEKSVIPGKRNNEYIY